MRVKVIANELVDADVQMVSLVKHGANRCPFKVLKSEEEPKTLGEKLTGLFKLSAEDCHVSAYFVRKDADEILQPILKAEGVDVSRREEHDGLIVYPQHDSTPKGFIQLNPGLAVGIDQSLKEHESDGIAKAYASDVQVSGFMPGVSLAATTLAGQVWTIFNKSSDLPIEARAESLDQMLGSLRKYVSSLFRILPGQVFKVESATHGLITEESIVIKPAEAVKPDADVKKTEEKTHVVSSDEGAVGAGAVDAVGGAGVASDPAAGNLAANSGADPAGEASVAKADPIAEVAKVLSAVTTSLEAILKRQEAIEKRLDDTETVAKSAEKKADQKLTVYKSVDADDDFTYGNLGGARRGSTIEKSDDELWGGFFDDVKSFRSNR